MRYLVAVLMLVAGLPAMTVTAAPAPDPFAILDIGPPRRGEALEVHRKQEIDRLGSSGWMTILCNEPDVEKLPVVARWENPRPWLGANLRIVQEDEGTRLRLTFRAGTRRDQSVILNGLVRAYLRETERHWRWHEDYMVPRKEGVKILLKRIESPADRWKLESDQRALVRLQADILEHRRIVKACQQVAVIRWAR